MGVLYIEGVAIHGGQTTGSGPQAAFRFAGGYQIPGGPYHFGERYMDPATGRWTQQDPLDRPSDLREGNSSLCTGDDPINLVDPTGLGALNVCAPSNPHRPNARCRSLPRVRQHVLPGFRAAATLGCVAAGLASVGGTPVAVACAYDAILETAKLLSGG